MEAEKNQDQEKEQETIQNKSVTWIEKTEEFIDDAAEKLHQSETYRKAGKSAEKVTKKLFRQAGKLWGKSERYLKNRNEEKRKTK